MAELLAGLHDREGMHLVPLGGWCLDTIALSENPAYTNYSQLFPGINWIVRANWGYGSTGTLPTPDKYGEYASRLAKYVYNSPGCSRWVVGNETNLSREWPDGKPIYPDQYAQCYRRAREVVHGLSGHEKDEVLVAASGPWNNELKYAGNTSGDWINYFIDVISACNGQVDGFSLHAYAHGNDISLVKSEATMEDPFQNRHYNFRVYRDYLNAVPRSLRHLPVYITEANGNGPWKAVGLIPAMLEEISEWNKDRTPVVRSMVFYRYPKYDLYHMVDKLDVLAEFTNAATRYPAPKALTQPQTPVAIVDADGGANVRTGPGLSYSILGAVMVGKALNITGKSADSSWWRVQSEYGDVGWVSGMVVKVANVQNVPVITVTVPVTHEPSQVDTWQRSYAFVRKWEGGFQDVYNDRGNWTGCEVGKGKLKGTNMGISACSYPDLDIKNITPGQAEAIYRTDYWQKSGADELPYPACLVVFDTAVLHGVNAAKAWLAEVGPNAYIFVARRLRSYLKADNWEYWDEAWVGRVIELLEYVGKG